MHRQNKGANGDLILAAIALIVAATGLAGILFDDFGTGNGRQSSSGARMITAAAVSKAGAVVTPSVPPTGRSAS